MLLIFPDAVLWQMLLLAEPLESFIVPGAGVTTLTSTWLVIVWAHDFVYFLLKRVFAVTFAGL